MQDVMEMEPQESAEGQDAFFPETGNDGAVAFAASDQAPGTAVSQDQLVFMLAEHQQWLDSEGKEGKRANFRSLDLHGLDLSGTNLVECSFRGANLSGANLVGADMRAADFAEANLDHANLQHALMNGTNLVRANISFANLSNADMSACNLGTSQGEGAVFVDTKLPGAIMRDAIIRSADFTRAALKGANLRGAIMSSSVMNEADMTTADCREANFDKAEFKQTVLEGAHFRGASLSGVDMNHSDFTKATEVQQTFQAESFQNERQKLQAEFAALQRTRDEIAAKEKKMQAERQTMDEDRLHMMQAMESAATQVARIRKSARWFTFTSVMWFAFTAGLCGLIYMLMADMDIRKVKIGNLLIVLTPVVAVFLMFFLSMLRGISMHMQAKRIHATYKLTLDQLSFGSSLTGVMPGATPSQPFRSVKDITHGPSVPHTAVTSSGRPQPALRTKHEKTSSSDTGKNKKPGLGFGKKNK